MREVPLQLSSRRPWPSTRYNSTLREWLQCNTYEVMGWSRCAKAGEAEEFHRPRGGVWTPQCGITLWHGNCGENIFDLGCRLFAGLYGTFPTSHFRARLDRTSALTEADQASLFAATDSAKNNGIAILQEFPFRAPFQLDGLFASIAQF
jgi:hypothetical protein